MKALQNKSSYVKLARPNYSRLITKRNISLLPASTIAKETKWRCYQITQTQFVPFSLSEHKIFISYIIFIYISIFFYFYFIFIYLYIYIFLFFIYKILFIYIFIFFIFYFFILFIFLSLPYQRRRFGPGSEWIWGLYRRSPGEERAGVPRPRGRHLGIWFRGTCN